MIVRWTRQAIRDRASIFDYLVAKNPMAALSIDHSFEQAAIQLGQFSHSGKSAWSLAPANFCRIPAIALSMR